MTDDLIAIDESEALNLATAALQACGAKRDVAISLASAAVDADRHGHHGQGIDHLDPYLDGLLKGRIDGHAEPTIKQPTPVIIQVDAHEGTAHFAFNQAFPKLLDATRTFGLAAISLRNSFPCGELGYFVRRLFPHHLGGLATTNAGPALLAGAGSTKATFCTNPLAFGMPTNDGAPILIDQSSSATAFTNLRIAARTDEKIPEGWALDKDGKPTTDAKAAIEGVLLAYGGYRGANMALMVELFAAGLANANWSVDAPPFHQGIKSPGGGFFMLALDPVKFIGNDAEERFATYKNRLKSDFDVHIPGERKFETAKSPLKVPASSRKMLKDYIAK